MYDSISRLFIVLHYQSSLKSHVHARMNEPFLFELAGDCAWVFLVPQVQDRQRLKHINMDFLLPSPGCYCLSPFYS